MNVLGTQVFQVGVRVTPEPDEPEMSGTDSCFPPYPYEFNGASNNGFKIEDVLASGKRSCGSSNVKASPVIKDITQYRSKNIGIAITGVSQCSEFGHWESSVDGARFSNINLEGKALKNPVTTASTDLKKDGVNRNRIALLSLRKYTSFSLIFLVLGLTRWRW